MEKITHTTVRNEKLFCLNCGGEHSLNLPLAVNDLTKKINAFNELHKCCQKTWIEPEADLLKSVEKRAMWWIANGETGMSSKTMWNCFMGNRNFPINHPHDPDDFKRCWKLLEAVPEWKSMHYMGRLRRLSKPWANLVDNWDKLNEYYADMREHRKPNGMYEFMQTLIL